jgi:hypothetical protein
MNADAGYGGLGCFIHMVPMIQNDADHLHDFICVKLRSCALSCGCKFFARILPLITVFKKVEYAPRHPAAVTGKAAGQETDVATVLRKVALYERRHLIVIG